MSGGAIFTDRNGNKISINSSGVFTDTLGQTVLTISGSGTPSSPTKLTYTNPLNAPVYFAVNYLPYTVKTNFGATSGGGPIAEYGPFNINLVDNVALPDGSTYKFQYETTPGSCTHLPGTQPLCVTGRITTVTLPTGGVITYGYTGGAQGINADGSAAGLTRAHTPGGTWAYARTNVSGSHWQTTVASPTGDDTTNRLRAGWQHQPANLRFLRNAEASQPTDQWNTDAASDNRKVLEREQFQLHDNSRVIPDHPESGHA